MIDFSNAHALAKTLDQADPLGHVADQFILPDGVIYLDGNSLGCMPKAAMAAITQTAQTEWAQDLIVSWNKADWFELPTTYGDILAPLIGADTGEVVICDTTSLNVYKAIFAGLSLRPDRSVIVAETSSFPTDLYMVEGVLAARGNLSMQLAESESDLLTQITTDTAVVLLNHVDYRTGKICDVAKITRHAHEVGAIVIWDLCHSAGNMPVDLNTHNVDFAIGCTYKYLNGGPGSPAFIFAAKRHISALEQPLTGWWGHAKPFAFDQEFDAAPSIRRFLCGTQPILSFRALKAGLDVFTPLSIDDIRAKSMSLTSMFVELLSEYCPTISLLSPDDAHQRGSQVSVTFANAYPVIQALIERSVIGDFRMPNIMRFGFSPLYTSHQDVAKAVEILADILESDIWRETRFQTRGTVT
ncbi:MAG: kynureninase [Rhodobacteraceae bacterium]|nr:kynureninase [Paracoccaceae bacterium]